MHSKYSIVYKGGNGQMIKEIDERFPEFAVIAPSTLVPETINSCDVLALVVTSQQVNLSRVLYFQGKQ